MLNSMGLAWAKEGLSFPHAPQFSMNHPAKAVAASKRRPFTSCFLLPSFFFYRRGPHLSAVWQHHIWSPFFFRALVRDP